MNVQTEGKESREPLPDPAGCDRSAPDQEAAARDVTAGSTESEFPGLTADADWPQLESPEFRELVLSIIATSIRLNPFPAAAKNEPHGG
jgi:hypothetical protein